MYCNMLRLDPTVLAVDRSPSMKREMPHRQYSLRVRGRLWPAWARGRVWLRGRVAAWARGRVWLRGSV